MEGKKIVKKIIYSLLIIGGCVLASIVIKEYLFPVRYAYSSWATPFNPKEHNFSFCKYDLPSKYEMLEYSKGSGFEYEKELLIFHSATSDQGLILLKLREHPKVDLAKVRVVSGKIHRMVNYSTTTFERGVLIRFLRPMFMTQEMIPEDDGLILKGEALGQPEYFETDKTQVEYVRGQFRQLGFYKPSSSILRKYPVPVIDFSVPKMGAVAVIKSKQTRKEIIVYNVDGIIPSSKLSGYEQKILESLANQTGETIFAIGYIEEGKEFNEEEFKQIVRSVTFDAMFPGGKMLDLGTPKSSQYTKTTATYQFGPFKWTRTKKKIGE